MKIVHSWLIDLAPLGTDAASIATVMTELGLAVEGIDQVGTTVPGVITARVIRTERHPDAAKVHRVFVDAGDGIERHVWCGAFNMQPGDVLPLATPGTVMPDGRAIEPKPILGISSDGMLCSARELGLGDDHAGIVVLPVGTPLGLPYGDALGLSPETVYDLDVTRNRPDCWGHLGVARDVAARLGVGVHSSPAPVVPSGPARSAPVDLGAGTRCARFTSTVISGVSVGTSPDYIRNRLAAAGMRPINNVVDASNYVMLELNQPNHAYDLATLGGGGFKVRCAADGETMVTLDGVERTLTATDLLICDANDSPIGIGGIMGGLHSEISDTTSTIALEMAWFEPQGIMDTATRLGLRSEASARFERGVDPYGMPAAIARFVELLALSCPDLIVNEGLVDARSASLPPERAAVSCRVAKVNQVLGTNIAASTMVALLGPIGFTTTLADDVLSVVVPSWRPDCRAEIDIVEEIARHFGYANVGRTVPKSAMHGRLSPIQVRRRALREVLLGLGISEAMPNPFLSPDDLVAAGLDSRAVRIVNPLAAEESVLRTSLRPGLLKAVAFNESHRRAGVHLFEIGHVYPPGEGTLPNEFVALTVVLAGAHAGAAMAVWRQIAAAMGLGARVDQSLVPAGLHPTRSATLSAGRDAIGAVGEVHPDVLDAYNVTERVAILELNLSVMLATEPRVTQWKPTSRFPSSDLDVAFSVPNTVVAEKVEKAIKQAAGNLLADLTLFDVYVGAGVADAARSLAYRLRLQALDRTLGESELASLRDKVIGAVGKLGATLRG